ncbi:LIM-domain binding protein-domain-containing protein [Gongronella butleri]|nr:LIM-domain binding protein-domain-containing protein [Gongronella butleri]
MATPPQPQRQPAANMDPIHQLQLQQHIMRQRQAQQHALPTQQQQQQQQQPFLRYPQDPLPTHQQQHMHPQHQHQLQQLQHQHQQHQQLVFQQRQQQARVQSQQPWMNNLIPQQRLPSNDPNAYKIMSTGHHLTGQGVLRLIQLGDRLAPGERAMQRSFWDGLVKDFFAPEAKMIFGVCHSHTKEQQQFEICQSLVARFFLTQYQCQVTSIQFHTDQTMEYFVAQGMMVDCPTSSFIYRYTNDTMVVLTGHTSMFLRMDPIEETLKIQEWSFVCQHSEEFIARNSLTDFVPPSPKRKKQPVPGSVGKSAPASFVNEWGLPARVHALLEMADAMTKNGKAGLQLLFQHHPQAMVSLSSSPAAVNADTTDPQQQQQQQQQQVQNLQNSQQQPNSQQQQLPSTSNGENPQTSPETPKKEPKKRQTKRKASTPGGRKNSKAQKSQQAQQQPPQPPTPQQQQPPAPMPQPMVDMPSVTGTPASMVASPQQLQQQPDPQQRAALLQQQLQQQKMFQLQHMQQLPSSPYPQHNIHITDAMINAYPPGANGAIPNAEKAYLTTPPSPHKRNHETT